MFRDKEEFLEKITPLDLYFLFILIIYDFIIDWSWKIIRKLPQISIQQYLLYVTQPFDDK